MRDSLTTPPPADAPKPAVSRGKKWRRRIILLLLAVIVLSGVARALVSVLLPPVLRKVAGQFGMTASYDKLEFYALGGDVGLWNLHFTPLAGGEPVVSTSYCRASISTLALLRGKLDVSRVEAEDAEVLIERAADGSVPLLNQLAGTPTAAPPAASGKPAPLSLDAPLTIDVLRLQNARARLRDLSLKPATDLSLDLDLLVTNVGSPTKPTRMDMQLHSPEALVALYVSATGTSRNNQLNADLAIKMYGLNLLPASAYLAPLGIVPVSNNISAQMAGHLQAKVIAGSAAQPAAAGAAGTAATLAAPSDVSVALSLTDLQMLNDSQPTASVKAVTVDVSSVGAGAIRINSVDVNGVRAAASRTKQGRLAFGGIELAPAPAAATSAPPPAAAPVQVSAASSPPIVELKKLTVEDVDLQFNDAGLAEATTLQLQLPTLSVEHVSTDPAQSSRPATLQLVATAPGLAKSIQLIGSATPGEATKRAELKLDVTGISPVAAKPYLAAMGIASDLTDGRLTCGLTAQLETNADGSLRAGLNVKDVRFADGGRELFAMASVKVDDASVNAGASRIKIGSISIEGPTVPIERDSAGAVSAFGLHAIPAAAARTMRDSSPASAAIAPGARQTAAPATRPAATAPAPLAAATTAPASLAEVATRAATAATAPAPASQALQAASSQPAAASAAASSSAATLPSIQIDHLRWQGVNVLLNDHFAGSAPLKLAVQDVAVEVTDFVFDPAGGAGRPGSVRVAMRAPGVVNQFTLDGTLTPGENALAIAVNGHAAGVTGDALKPALATMGIVPVMHEGTLDFAAAGSMKADGGTISADLALTNVSLFDGATHWFSLGGFSIRHAAFDGHVASIDAVQIDQPAALIVRDANGVVSLAGVKLQAPAMTGSEVAGLGTSAETPATQPAPEALATTTGASPTAGALAAAPATTPTAGALRASPTTLPAAAGTRLDLSFPIIARLKSFKLNDAAITMQDAAVLPATNVSGTVNVSAENLALGEDATASPFSVTVTSPGVIDSLKLAGSFKLAPLVQRIDLTVTGAGVYGQALEPYLPPNAKIDFNNGEFGANLTASIEPNADGGSKASLAVTDIQLKDGIAANPVAAVKALRIGVDRIDLPGGRIALGEVAVEGVRFAVAQDEQGLSLLGLTFAPQPLRAPRPAPPVVEAPPVVVTAVASDVNALALAAHAKLPLVTLQKLSVQADRLSFSSPALAKELALTGVSLTNSNPIELLGDDPKRRPPFDLTLQAAVEQLVNSITLSAHLAPLAADPSAKLALSVTGIHANQLTAFLPKLKESLDGQDLSDGHFVSTAEAQFKFTRRGPMGIDLTRDITAELSITKTRLTQNGNDQPLAGVDEILGQGMRYSPASGSFIVKSLDITKPVGRVMRDEAGIHALGLTIKSGPVTAQPTTQAVAGAPEAGAVVPVAAPPTTQPASPAAEMRIDRLTISGVDFVIEDHLGTEPTIVPINALDVEVKGLSTAALLEPKSIRFSALIGSGKVSLPAIDAKANGVNSERPVFTEASASGNLTLVPKPKGYVKVSLSGLEMAAIRGVASQAGIRIERGTFDLRTDMRMDGGDAFEARVYPTFNELRISEPANGVIQRILKLPAPLDVVVAALEDTDGSISLPLTVPLQAGKLDTGAVIDSAVGSIARVIAEAMLAAPLKAANMIAMLGGADLSADRSKDLAPVTVDFAAGESQVTSVQQTAINSLLARLKKDDSLQVTIQHTLSAADVGLAEQRSNPQANDSLELAARLRSRKDVLQQQLAERQSRMRVALASQNPAAVDQALTALRATSIELKETDDGLNQVLTLLAPGALKQTDRRTKAAAILLGDLRLRSVQQAMLRSDVTAISERVRKANAMFNPDDAGQPGRVTFVVTRRAKQ